MPEPVDPQQRLLSPHERVADDVYLALLNTADDYADGDLIVGNLYALRDAVTAEVLPTLDRLVAEVERLTVVGNRWKRQAEQAEAAIERVRRMAQVWVDIRPTYPTASDAGHGIAFAGQQILNTLISPIPSEAADA